MNEKLLDDSTANASSCSLENAESSTSEVKTKRLACLGSKGLHQNNYKGTQQQFSTTHDNTIAEVFRKFCDKCILKLRDGIHGSPGLKESTASTDNVDSTCLNSEDIQQQNNETNIDYLPYYCKLIILSKLDTNDICNLSMTSRHWSEVCSDPLLWRELLYRDMLKWHSIGYQSFPLISLAEYCEILSNSPNFALEDHIDVDNFFMPKTAYDLRTRLCCKQNINFKALYFHSAFQRHKEMQLIGGGVHHVEDADKFYEETEENFTTLPVEQQLASNQSFPRFLRSLWMRMRSGNGEVIMLGPGLESPNTSKIFRRLLWARPDLLITQGLLPGSQDGVGSGVELDFKGEKRFNLIALYSGNNRERKRRFGLKRLKNSNIVEESKEVKPDTSPEEETAAEPPSETSTHQENPSTQNDHSVPILKFKLRELVFNFLKQRADTYRLIYVVDATKDQPLDQLSCNRLEVQALVEGIRSCESNTDNSTVNTNVEGDGGVEAQGSTLSSIINFTGISTNNSTCSSRRPFLILSCVQSKHVERIPCVEIASLLDLASITDRPWYVQDVTVDNLTGLESGLNWLFKQD